MIEYKAGETVFLDGIRGIVESIVPAEINPYQAGVKINPPVRFDKFNIIQLDKKTKLDKISYLVSLKDRLLPDCTYSRKLIWVENKHLSKTNAISK